ncbi:MAG TPA: hypothetical protein VF548_06610 [Allosphingosinicella sp.]|jgi:hypothetical protein
MKNDVVEQLAISSEDLQFIRAELSSKPSLQPICHRFSAHEFLNEVETEACLSALVPALSRQGFDVDAVGGAFVEAWELARPSEEWSEKTVRKLCAIADEAGFAYDGWTWEPSGRPSYLRRVMSASLFMAPLLGFIFVLHVGWSWTSGEVVGSPGSLGIRILGAVAFVVIGSLLVAAYTEWQESRKYR